MTSGWWRRNRWGLVALPLALAAALAASSYRLTDLWWDVELRHAVTAEPNEVAQLRTTYDDASGEHPREVDLRLVRVRERDDLELGSFAADPTERYVPPAGLTIFELEIAWSADPDLPLGGCNVELVTADGDVLGTAPLDLVVSPPDPCTPAWAPGPLPDVGAGVTSSTDVPRPQRWTTRAYVLASVDAEPASVRVWWTPPDYASLEVAARD